jgi:hypothetical protein
VDPAHRLLAALPPVASTPALEPAPVRTDDVLLTIAAGALGAVVAALMVGASLLLVVPAALGVGAVSLAGGQRRRR